MSDRSIASMTDLMNVLSRITFAPSCVDMGWKWAAEFVDGEGREGWLISTTFQRPDTNTGIIGRGIGRQWFVAKGTTVSGVVKTAFAAAKMILEHELMEAFFYDGARIFDPHNDVESLASIARKR